MSFQHIKDDGLSSFMTGLQYDSKLVQKEDGFAFYCGFRAEEQNHAVFVLMGFNLVLLKKKCTNVVTFTLDCVAKAFFIRRLCLKRSSY